MDAGRQTGACHFASEHLAQRAKNLSDAAARVERRCQMRTRAKEVDNMKSFGNQKGDMSPPSGAQMLSCHLVWLGKVGPAITTNREPNPCRVEHRTETPRLHAVSATTKRAALTPPPYNLADDERAEAGRLLSSFLMGSLGDPDDAAGGAARSQCAGWANRGPPQVQRRHGGSRKPSTYLRRGQMIVRKCPHCGCLFRIDGTQKPDQNRLRDEVWALIERCHDVMWPERLGLRRHQPMI